jgi:soluble lytic murein transglycosylase
MKNKIQNKISYLSYIQKYVKKVAIILIISITIYFLSLFILKNVMYPYKHSEDIKTQAAANNLDPYLILAIIKTESGFNKDAVSNKQAKGLMQIMDSTASDINKDSKVTKNLSKENIYDVDINISLGCKYFKSLINRYNGNYYLAICAYNAGMGNVDKWIEQGLIPKDLDVCTDTNIPFKETKQYLKKVINSYKMYRLLY